MRKFQSAPLTKARGDIPDLDVGLTHRIVSIRSPHKSKGRRPPAGKSVLPRQFQSAPLTKARGDSSGLARLGRDRRFNPLPSQKQGETCGWSRPRPRGRGFNPLPSQKQGETAIDGVYAPMLEVSIRSPHKSKGRLVRAGKVGEVRAVSIRSPHKSKGRHPETAKVLQRAKEFQSAPLTKARGDGAAG